MADLNNITVGCRVSLEDKRTGKVRFIGPVHFRPGVIAGVELDDPYVGSSDGSVNGWRYFDAPDQKAVFVKRAELLKIEDSESVHSYSGEPTPHGRPESIPLDTYPQPRTGRGTGGRAEPSEESFDDYPPTRGGHGKSNDWDNQHQPKRYRRSTDIDDSVRGHGDEDDKYDRWKRGMAAALEHELLDYKSDPNDTGVCVNYALYEPKSHEDITSIQKRKLKQAIANALPQDIKPQQLKIKFEDLGDYTEMKVKTDAESAEEADDLKWSMLDPIHVRKFNEEMEKDADTDLVKCEYTYLERREDGCCRWVKPCIACICCWLLLLTLLLGLLFGRLMALNRDVEDLQKRPAGGGNGTASCSGFDICDQIAANRDQIAKNTECCESTNFKKMEVVKEDIDNTGAATVRCPDHDWELISCWVYLPNHWVMFQTYVDSDPSGFPDCSCYCQHKDDSFWCKKIGAECRAQCAQV